MVEDKLALKWSAEQLSGWLRRTYSVDPVMQVSHETIYVSLFVQSREALRRELCAHLRGGTRVRRARRRGAGEARGRMSDMVMISARPAEAEDRAVLGHWEGDLLLGKRSTGIATLVERTSRYTQLSAARGPQGRTGPRRARAEHRVASVAAVALADLGSR